MFANVCVRYCLFSFACGLLLIGCGGGNSNTAGEAHDQSPPSQPANLVADTVSASTIVLTWSASTDDTATTGYRIYRDNAAIGTSTTTSYEDQGLTPDTQYEYTVLAYDAAGNESDLSDVLAQSTAEQESVLGNNAMLSSLSLSGITLNESFAGGRTSYSASVGNEVSSTNLTASLVDAAASFTINNQAASSGQAFALALSEGANVIELRVTAEDGVTQERYTITVTRDTALGNNAMLSSLSLSGITLNESFVGSRTSYSASVGNAVSSTELTVTVADVAASLTVNGEVAVSGLPTLVTLNEGGNLLEVVVLAGDSVTETSYFLTITRESSSPAVGDAVAIDMKFHLLRDRQKFLTLAAYSNDITYRQASYTDAVIDFGVRYKDAITSWDLQSLPSHGTLYEGYDEISTLPYSVSNPDDLLYVPDSGYMGNDAFTFSVQDSSSTSNVGTISLIIESSVSVPAGIAALPSIFHTPTPVPATSGDVETIDWYVDNSHPDATDEPRNGESDPRHGTPDTPRATIPPSGADIMAGASVFISGGVQTPYELRSGLSWHRWELLGTAENPVYILGVNQGPDKPLILGPGKTLRLEAQNTIIDGLNFRGMAVTQRNDTGAIDGDNMVIKHTILDRDFNGTSGAGATFNVGDTKVLYDVHVRNAGRTEPDLADENDVHGIQISSVSDFWILDSLIHNSAGDSIQINGEFAQGLYIGRNKLHSDNENAIDFKRRYDLVFVENDAWDYRAIEYGSSGSDGAAVIINQDTNGQTPTYSVIARNRIWDVNRAIRHQGNHIWTSDNVMWHVHHNVNASSRSYAISVGNNADADYYDHIVNNTFHMVDGGIWVWASPNNGTTDHRYLGNVFGTLNEDSRERVHISINSNHDHGTTLDYNYYAQSAVVLWAGNQYTVSELQNNTGQGQNSDDQVDLQFNNPAVFDLRPKASSPLVDNNIEHAVYSEVQNRYGINSALDNDLDSRPINGLWDIGAYER